MKQQGLYLIIILAFFMVYFFLFPRESSLELVIQPESIIHFDTLTTHSTTGLLEGVFQSGNRVIFYDQNGFPVYNYLGENVAVDDSWWVNADGDFVEIRDPVGNLRSRISNHGLPYTRRGQLFLIDAAVNRVSKMNPENGSEIWSREYISTITVLDAGPNRTLVGLLDGRIYIVDDDGNTVLKYQASGSRVEGVYGGALSLDGNRLALVNGLDPQRFIVLEESRKELRPVTHHPTGTDLRRFVPVKFIWDDAVAMYEVANGLCAVERSDLMKIQIPLDGIPLIWHDIPDFDVVSILSGNMAFRSLEMLSRHYKIFFKSRLPVEIHAMKFAKDKLFLGWHDGYVVMRLELL